MKPCAEHRLGSSLGNDAAPAAAILRIIHVWWKVLEQQDGVGVERVCRKHTRRPASSIEYTAISLSQTLQRTTGVLPSIFGNQCDEFLVTEYSHVAPLASKTDAPVRSRRVRPS
jgi:hypothetical protein